MCYQKAKREALNKLERSKNNYDTEVERVNTSFKNLYDARCDARDCLLRVEKLVNSIANTPKKYEKAFSMVAVTKMEFKDASWYEEQVEDTITDISTSFMLEDVDYLPKGDESSSGASDVFLSALEFIGKFAILASYFVEISKANLKAANEAIEEAKRIDEASAMLRIKAAEIDELREETVLLSEELSVLVKEYSIYEGKKYKQIQIDVRTGLGTMVNITLALSELINKNIRGD
ncbi:MAG: hypothetical protein K5745_00960 [Saccharofermentans sp.]|nr:hypothetical protein [Saccharofermentans sp.]